jgi:GTP-binding protein
MPFLKNSPYIFVSAVEKQRLKKILDLALNIKEEMKRTVTEKELERFLSRIVKRRKPVPSRGTKRPHIFKITQVEGRTPAFEVRIRSTDTLHFSYVRYIENQLRERYGFDGSPVSVYVVRNKSEDNK